MGPSLVQRHPSFTLRINSPSKLPAAFNFSESTMDEQAPSFAMQRYLDLQNQHEELRQNLNTIRTTATFSTRTTSLASSPAVSPTRGPCTPFGQYPSSRRHSRRSSLAGPPRTRRSSTSLQPLADESILYQVAEEERRLFDVNEGMKRALTELLNGQEAKADGAFRTWVLCRLMDTEKEMRSERRRKSAP
ncbi:hypothetical protein ACHAQH_003843 [Verticillium albo-atrum]